MVRSHEYSTFQQASSSGNLLGGFTVGEVEEDQYPEHFIITTHRLPWAGINRQHYRLYVVRSEEDGKLRPSDRIEWIGVITWALYGRPRQAQIANAEIFSDVYRGRGLGRRLYVESINDLIDKQRVPISDVYRSEYAERVWSSLIEANPGAIQVQPRVVPEYEYMELQSFRDEAGTIMSRKQYYEVLEHVQRRPDVRVREHRRRA